MFLVLLGSVPVFSLFGETIHSSNSSDALCREFINRLSLPMQLYLLSKAAPNDDADGSDRDDSREYVRNCH